MGKIAIMNTPAKTFNDTALEKVCRALDYLENDRLNEAYTAMRAVRADLLVEIGKERKARGDDYKNVTLPCTPRYLSITATFSKVKP